MVDELMQYELTRETQFESEEQMRQRISQFKDIDFSSETATDRNNDSAESVASHLSGQDSQFLQIQDILKNMNVDSKAAISKKDYGVKASVTISREEYQAQMAYQRL